VDEVTIRQPRKTALLYLFVIGYVPLLFIALFGVARLPFDGRSVGIVALGLLPALMVPAGLVYRARVSSLTVGPKGIRLRGYFLDWQADWSQLAGVEHVPYRPSTPPITWQYVLIHGAPGTRLPAIGVPTRAAVAGQLGRGEQAFVPLIGNRFEGGHEALLAAFRRYAPAQVPVSAG